MDLHVELSQAVVALRALQEMRAPHRVADWSPSPEQKADYIGKCEQVVAAVERLLVLESHQVYAKGQVQAYVPGPLLKDVRSQLLPVEADLWVALGALDPDNQLLRELMYRTPASSSTNRIRSTFAEGVTQVFELLERNPDADLDLQYTPVGALEVLDSRLIQFDPDSWRARALLLAPVRVGHVNLVLPGHLRLRLLEIYRTFVFGCWISVVSLCRSALEYALLDNSHRLNIDTNWPADRDGKARKKRLADLIDDYTAMLPELADDLASLRELGNAYLHPKATRADRRALESLEADAGCAVGLLVPILETVYLHKRDA